MFFRSSNSLEVDHEYKEITMKGRKNQFFRKGNSLEAISLERESTVVFIESGSASVQSVGGIGSNGLVTGVVRSLVFTVKKGSQ